MKQIKIYAIILILVAIGPYFNINGQTITPVSSIVASPQAFNGQEVTLEGKTLYQKDDDEYMFSDGTGQIELDFQKGNIPTVGKQIVVTGRVEYEDDDNELEVNVVAWQYKDGAPAPVPEETTIGNILSNSGQYIGKSVTVQGTIISKVDDDEFMLEDNTGTIKLDFPEGHTMPIINDVIKVTGRVGYDDDVLEIDVSSWEKTSGGGPIEPPAPTATTVEQIKANPSSFAKTYVLLSGKTLYKIVGDDDDEYMFSDNTGEIKVEFESGNIATVGRDIDILGYVENDDDGLEVDILFFEYKTGTAPTPENPSISDINSNPNLFIGKLVQLDGVTTEQVGSDMEDYNFTDGTSIIIADFPKGWIPDLQVPISITGRVEREDNGSIEIDVNNWELLSSVKISGELPESYSLSQNYPNPFNPTTKINFSIPESGYVELTVYDLAGRLVSKLVSEHLSAGIYSQEFGASSLSSGIYFYRITAGNFVEVKKMTLLK